MSVMNIRAKWCRLAKQHHKESIRSFAHVFHYKNTICLTPEFQLLPLGYQLGIVLHELGHLAYEGKNHSEADADEMGFILSGVRIERKTYHTLAKNLEWIRPADHEQARDFIKECLAGFLAQ